MKVLKLGHDNNPLEHDEFVRRYGAAAEDLWVTALGVRPGAPQPGPSLERRRGHDGCPRTWSDFVNLAGPTVGSALWLQASPVSPTEMPASDGSSSLVLQAPAVLVPIASPSDVPASVDSLARPVPQPADGIGSVDSQRQLQTASCAGAVGSQQTLDDPEHQLQMASSAGASQPGNLQLVPEQVIPADASQQVSVWESSAFCSDHLPEQSRLFAESRHQVVKATTLRGFINLAYELYDYLPLQDSAIADFSLSDHLGLHDAVLITAEIVNRISDHNRLRPQRVDIFVYLRNDDVVRFHLGKSASQSAKPHRMIWPSPLYITEKALLHGVGQSLHASPPGLTVSGGAPQPAQPLFLIPAHLELFDVYDVQACGWRHMQNFFMKLDWKGGKEVDITMGEHYPWLFFLANSDTMRTAIKKAYAK